MDGVPKMTTTRVTESSLADAGILDQTPLTTPLLDWFGRLFRTPCRASTRILVSTRQHKHKAARALIQQVETYERNQ